MLNFLKKYSSLYLLFISFFSYTQDSFLEKPIVIVIASYNNADWYKENLDSVFNQKYSNYRIVYIDDCSPDGTGNLVEQYISEKNKWDKVVLLKNEMRRLKMANTYMAYHEYCKDEEIVVELDGDDWLSHENVLRNINKLYSESDIWMSYGNFMEWPTGRLQKMCSIPESDIENKTVRKISGCFWAGLRTYYAWLVKQVALGDLFYKGMFLPYTSDAVIMFAMFDMSGKRFAFITDDIWLQHNVKTPLNDHKVDKSGLSGIICRESRNKKPYERLEKNKIGYFESFNKIKSDIIVLCSDQIKTETLINSMERYVSGINEIFIIESESELNDLLFCVSDYVLLVSDNYIFVENIEIDKCIKMLEETKAYSFIFSIDKLFNIPRLHQYALNDTYAYQFSCCKTKFKSPNKFDGILCRKFDLLSGFNPGKKIGLFFQKASVVEGKDQD